MSEKPDTNEGLILHGGHPRPSPARVVVAEAEATGVRAGPQAEAAEAARAERPVERARALMEAILVVRRVVRGAVKSNGAVPVPS